MCPGGSELSAPLCPHSHALQCSLLAALKSHISLLESLLFFSSSLLAFLSSLLTNQFLCFLSLTFHGTGFLGAGSPCRPLLSEPELARAWVSTLHRLLPAATPEHVMCPRAPGSGGWPTGALLPRGGALPSPRRLQHSSACHVQHGNVRAVPSRRYKQQLSAAADRERCLERERAQLELDWRQRCDSVERDHYRKSEDLIQALTEARDQVCTPSPVRFVLHRVGREEGSGLSPRRRSSWKLRSLPEQQTLRNEARPSPARSRP